MAHLARTCLSMSVVINTRTVNEMHPEAVHSESSAFHNSSGASAQLMSLPALRACLPKMAKNLETHSIQIFQSLILLILSAATLSGKLSCRTMLQHPDPGILSLTTSEQPIPIRLCLGFCSQARHGAAQHLPRARPSPSVRKRCRQAPSAQQHNREFDRPRS